MEQSHLTTDLPCAMPQTLGTLDGVLVLKDEADGCSRDLEFILASKLVTILRDRRLGNNML